MVRFPAPLRPGDLIGITAPSAGVAGAALARLDLAISHLRGKGFRVLEGRCLRGEHKEVSAPREARAEELMRFLTDPDVAAVWPPWGGELATELLDLVDFDALRSSRPIWFCGYSDLSTLQLPLLLRSGWASAHGPNLMDLIESQSDALTTGALGLLASGLGEPVTQHSSTHYQVDWTPYEQRVDAPFNLTQRTEWRRLDQPDQPITVRGRLVGGCLDTIVGLAGTPYGDVPEFIANSASDGVLLFLENAEMSPPELVRSLVSLRRHGWFEGLQGLLIGRSSGPVSDDPARLTYREALSAALQGVQCPVLFDLDIGHRPPQFTLINGARVQLKFEDGGGWISQQR
jgi:muramoyltetrapeptide carboxypeptidase